ncbi:MAG: hypothetical protein COA88_08950 [Kordia sp.]|nr:MAG: hypothetical protein COA88_08950 [Kordia sp.]
MSKRKEIIKEHFESSYLKNDDLSSFEKSVIQKIKERITDKEKTMNDLKIEIHLFKMDINTH